jgi:predicted CXXCH cytochrome family protein
MALDFGVNRYVLIEERRMKSAVRYILQALVFVMMTGPLVSVHADTARPLTPGEGVDIYLQEVAPMSTLECGKCHYEIFTTIREKGGQHQLDCRDCHNKFHTFTPGVAWKDRVPDCNDCHDGVHEGSFPLCLSCHQQAHAPLASLVAGDELAAECGNCHAAVSSAIQQYPSGHADVGCIDCHHEQHGFKPGCNECHPEPHMPFQNNAECMTCHQVHTPLQISLGDEVNNSVCQGCHSDPVDILTASKKKHAPLNCVFCHAKTHGTIPSCQECHGNGPHNPDLLKEFKGCLECHGDPHSLTLSGS